VVDTTLYLFDGYNLLHAGSYPDPRELIDTLAGFVAMEGARGILVFDGVGPNGKVGRLEIRYAEDADTALERLAAEHRGRERVCLVSSDAAVRGTSGQEVQKLSSRTFLRDLPAARHQDARRSSLADRLDEKTLERLERLRRGED
jgi:predicted RNA-binding protein with PIN domain